MFIVLMGGGQVGYYLSRELIADKHTVTLIDKDKSVCEQIAREIENIIVICGDGSDKHILEAAGIKQADVFAALTGIDEENLIACQLAKEVFNIKRTISRVNDPRSRNIFNKCNVDTSINTTGILIKIIEEEASLDDYMPLLAIKKGKISLVRVDLHDAAPVVGKLVRDIVLPKNCVLVTILRGEEVIIPKGDTLLSSGDDVIALASIENERDLLHSLIGDL
ncbi:MAG: TrkA family potassium uptake protein [Candidatus Firestonebacteria bacterium]|nr:TrkA family potassium uptake protein [Candidatus Firestonebacteria bacterium]